ncbi:MAG: LCP family protein [Eubacterium sp.]|nr:LCP family protein [Eubacterium sp.]
MKRQIDPNLSGLDNDDILSSLGGEKPAAAVSPAPALAPEPQEAQDDFHELKEDIKSYQEARAEAEREKSEEHHHHHHHHHRHRHRHHHHSSGSSSHHSSSKSGKKGKKSKKDKKKLPTALKIALIIFLVLALAISTVFGTFVYLRYKGKKDIMPATSGEVKYEEIIEYNGHKYKFNEDVVALAFIGVDQRTLETSAETDFVGCADADIVIAVDTNTGKTNVIAIPRDTMVDVDIYSADTGLLISSKTTQLCLAYAHADGDVLSCQNTVDAMSRILNNVPIQKYFVLDLDGIAPLNDAIGGVDIPSSLYAFPDEGIRIGDPVTLKGEMAEKYVRTRDNDYLEASLNRTERQMQYVKAFAAQSLPAVVRDFSTVSRLYNTSKNYSKTNLSLSNATYIASLLLQKNIRDFTGTTLKGEMKSSPVPDPDFPDFVYAEFYPDKDFLMQTVLNAFYTQID